VLGASTLSLPLLQSSVGFHFSSEFQLLTLIQTENLANLSTRKGASMDLCTFQKIGLKDLDTFRSPKKKRRKMNEDDE